MKASEFFAITYNTIGRSRLRNRPQFLTELFIAGGSHYFTLSPNKKYDSSDYRFKIFNGSKPLSGDIIDSFGSGVDTDGVYTFFAGHIKAKDTICNLLLERFGVDSGGCLSDPDCLAMALSLQFKAFIDFYNETDNIVPQEYERLYTDLQNGVPITTTPSDETGISGRDLVGFVRQLHEEAEIQNKVVPGQYCPQYDYRGLVDRIELLVRLRNSLRSHAGPVYLHAVGGLGKTEVAKAFCTSEHVATYTSVFWITASSKDIREDIMKAPPFKFSRDAEANIADEFGRFVVKMKTLEGPVLLVIDDVISTEQIESLENGDSVGLLHWDTLVTTRAVIDDAMFMERVIPLEELEERHCAELFCRNYTRRELSPPEQVALLAIFRALNYHTLLVILLAKVGKTRGLSIAKLAALVGDQGIMHDDLQIDISVNVRNRQQDRKPVEEIIGLLFDYADLSADEQYILQCLSLLPNRALPEDLLLEWVCCDTLTKRRAASLLRKLHDNGWLTMDTQANIEGVQFGCHSLIRTTVRNGLNDFDKIQPFLRNVAGFFHTEILDDRRPEHLRYADCIATIIENCPSITEMTYILRKDYTGLLNQYDTEPLLAHENAEWLKDNYAMVFPKKDGDTAWASGWVEVLLLHADTFLNSTTDRGKYVTLEKMRLDAWDFAKANLPELHMSRIKAERHYISAKLNNGKYVEAMAGFQAVSEKLDKIADGHASDDEWRYECLRTLAMLGMSYNRLAEQNEADWEKYIPLTLEVREKYLKTALNMLGESNAFLRNPYNDLGMTNMYLYDKDPQPHYLERARYFLTKRLEVIAANFNEGSPLYLSALDRLARLLEREGKLRDALDMNKEILESRRARKKNDYYKDVMQSYFAVARVSFKIFRKSGDDESLSAAMANICKTIDIADHLYNGDKSIKQYKEALRLQEEIEAAVL